MGKWMNLFVKTVLKVFQGHLHIVMCLKIQPELCFHIKEAPKAQCSVGGYGAPSMDDFIYSPWRHANIFGQPILSNAQGLQEFRQQDFARVNRRKITFCHNVTSQ